LPIRKPQFWRWTCWELDCVRIFLIIIKIINRNKINKIYFHCLFVYSSSEFTFLIASYEYVHSQWIECNGDRSREHCLRTTYSLVMTYE
jgi:hypothetical protein